MTRIGEEDASVVYLVWESVGKRQFRSRLLDPATAMLLCRGLMACGDVAVIATPCDGVRRLPVVGLPQDCQKFGPIGMAEAARGYSLS